MRQVRIGFRAFDPHELLVHFVAEEAGLYSREGIAVELVDLRTGEHQHDATVACGAALFAALGGDPIRIRLIASAAPLFWLYGRDGDPAGARIATYPRGAPPGRFLELALDTDATFLPAGDDEARLALVRSGKADYALLSSATPPSRVSGLEPVVCLADRIPVPSTGIAAREATGVEDLTSIHRAALTLLEAEPGLAWRATRRAFGFDEREAEWAVDVARRYFTREGRAPASYLENAVRLLGGGFSPYAPSAVI